MNTEQIVAMYFRDQLAQLPAGEKAKAEEAIAAIEKLIREHGDYAKFAVGFVGAQLAAEIA